GAEADVEARLDQQDLLALLAVVVGVGEEVEALGAVLGAVAEVELRHGESLLQRCVRRWAVRRTSAGQGCEMTALETRHDACSHSRVMRASIASLFAASLAVACTGVIEGGAPGTVEPGADGGSTGDPGADAASPLRDD